MISFFVRRKKYIYCRLKLEGVTKDRATGIKISANWKDSKKVRDYEKKLSMIIKTRKGHTTPEFAFKLLEAKSEGRAGKTPFSVLHACDYYVKTTASLKGLSNHSIKTYDYCKLAFFKYLLEEHHLPDISLARMSTSIAKGYRAWLNSSGFANDTIHLYINFMKSVLETVLEDFPMDECPDLGIKFNPFKAKKIYQVKKKSNIMEFIQPAMVPKLWEYADEEFGLLALFMCYSGYSFADSCTEPDFTVDLEGNKFMLYNRHKSKVQARVLVYDELDKIVKLIQGANYKGEYNNWLPVKKLPATRGKNLCDWI